MGLSHQRNHQYHFGLDESGLQASKIYTEEAFIDFTHTVNLRRLKTAQDLPSWGIPLFVYSIYVENRKVILHLCRGPKSYTPFYVEDRKVASFPC